MSKPQGDNPEAPRWAADEPTAMWDDSLLADAGYADLAKHRAEQPRTETGPATERGVKGDVDEKVAVSSELTGGHAALPAPRAPKGGGALSWVLTVLVAIGVGVAAYFVVRWLR
ncbi:MAG TPA: hypothetical protein VIL20_07450 [Sandaracinaceae bacterium]